MHRLEELELLALDPDAFEDFFDDLEQIKNSKKIEEDLLQSNKDLAEKVLTRQKDLEEAKARILKASEEQRGLRKEYDQLIYKHQNELLVWGSLLFSNPAFVKNG
jgi:hypothetical protein